MEANSIMAEENRGSLRRWGKLAGFKKSIVDHAHDFISRHHEMSLSDNHAGSSIRSSVFHIQEFLSIVVPDCIDEFFNVSLQCTMLRIHSSDNNTELFLFQDTETVGNGEEGLIICDKDSVAKFKGKPRLLITEVEAEYKTTAGEFSSEIWDDVKPLIAAVLRVFRKECFPNTSSGEFELFNVDRSCHEVFHDEKESRLFLGSLLDTSRTGLESIGGGVITYELQLMLYLPLYDDIDYTANGFGRGVYFYPVFRVDSSASSLSETNDEEREEFNSILDKVCEGMKTFGTGKPITFSTFCQQVRDAKDGPNSSTKLTIGALAYLVLETQDKSRISSDEEKPEFWFCVLRSLYVLLSPAIRQNWSSLEDFWSSKESDKDGFQRVADVVGVILYKWRDDLAGGLWDYDSKKLGEWLGHRLEKPAIWLEFLRSKAVENIETAFKNSQKGSGNIWPAIDSNELPVYQKSGDGIVGTHAERFMPVRIPHQNRESLKLVKRKHEQYILMGILEAHFGIGSGCDPACVVPLTAKGQLLGSIVCTKKGRGRSDSIENFSTNELFTLECIAQAVAGVIQESKDAYAYRDLRKFSKGQQGLMGDGDDAGKNSRKLVLMDFVLAAATVTNVVDFSYEVDGVSPKKPLTLLEPSDQRDTWQFSIPTTAWAETAPSNTNVHLNLRFAEPNDVISNYKWDICILYRTILMMLGLQAVTDFAQNNTEGGVDDDFFREVYRYCCRDREIIKNTFLIIAKRFRLDKEHLDKIELDIKK